MEITTDDYTVQYDKDTATIHLAGFLRLNGMEEYQPVMNVLLGAVDHATQLTIDLRQLEFLNSSGISMLSMFIVKVRDMGTIDLTLCGSDKILWQTKSLKNLQRLMPRLTLEFA